MKFRFPWRSERQIARDVDEELDYHLETRVAQLMGRGLTEETARRQAVAEFGDLEGTRRYCRDHDLARERELTRRARVADLAQDIRYALRSLRRRPAVTAVVTGSLALAVGINTAMFSVVNAALFRALPYPDPARLVQVHEADEDVARKNLTDPNLRDLVEQSRTLASVGAWRSGPSQVSFRGQVTVATIAIVTPGFFPSLAVEPAEGRVFAPQENANGGPPAAIVSHGFWRRIMGGDAGALGQTITADARAFTVVGIMPPGFAFPRAVDLWIPDQVYSLRASSRTSHNLQAVARLAPGATLEAASTELATIGRRLAQAWPSELKPGFRFTVVPLADELTRGSRDSLVMLLVLVTLVLLMGCANLAFVLLAQATARGREIAIRQAIGGGTARITRQLLTESATLGLIGGAGGLLLTLASLGLLNRMVPAAVLHSGPVTLDWRVAAYAITAGLLAGLAFGLAPAWRASRLEPGLAIRSEGPMRAAGTGRRRVGNGLLVFQYATSFAAVVTAAVMVRSLVRLQSVESGFATEGRVAAQLLIPVREGTRYGDYRSAMALLDRLGERMGAMPGIRAVAFDRTPPLSGTSFNQRILTEAGNPTGSNWPDSRTISPGYFGLMGIPLLAGRDFVRGDSAGAMRVAIVNEALARLVWPGQDPVGRVFKRWEDDPWITVVGVAGDVRTRLDHEARLAIYLPMYQDPFRTSAMTLIAQGQGGGAAIGALVREALRAEDPELALRDLRTMEEIRLESIALPRFRTRLVTGFGALALLLVVLGVYGVMAYAASLRKREMAVRSALGASRRHLIELFVDQGLRVAVAGTGFGVALALALSRLLRTLVFDVDAVDPLMMAAILPLMVGSVLAACLLPARSAARADPAEALKDGAMR